MALQVQQRTFSNVGGSSYRVEDVLHHITLIVASTPHRFYRIPPIFRSTFSDETLCDDMIKTFLHVIKIPQTFFNGRDCDMVENLSRMLRTEILLEQPHHQNGENYLSIVFVILEGCCRYKIVKSSPSYHDEKIVISELVCNGGESSFPAGASAIQRLKIEDKEDNCAICLQEFVTGSDAARLPCSHVYHDTCIMEWFVQCGTCPMCRFHCS
ncbi:hypothetical protein RIF29_30156 [Crotalaria pallida]|uniref:RING-type domain-containing protein n=1 Tax=Crotalaria pallida TaxID=3830 RepID=A0AAN9EGM2_CROPI